MVRAMSLSGIEATSWVSPLFVIAFAVLVLACLLCLVVSHFVFTHLQRCHRDVWKQLKFPRDSPYCGVEYERETVGAQRRLFMLLLSKRRTDFRDARLDRLTMMFFVNGAVVLTSFLVAAYELLRSF
jgi:hypothetical protein